MLNLSRLIPPLLWVALPMATFAAGASLARIVSFPAPKATTNVIAPVIPMVIAGQWDTSFDSNDIAAMPQDSDTQEWDLMGVMSDGIRGSVWLRSRQTGDLLRATVGERFGSDENWQVVSAGVEGVRLRHASGQSIWLSADRP